MGTSRRVALRRPEPVRNETDAVRASGHEHVGHVSTRLAAGGPAVYETAALGMLTAPPLCWRSGSTRWWRNLRPSSSPSSTYNSFVAMQDLGNATLVLYTGAGHAFLFQYAKAFTKQVADFLAA
jgi:pimeloyl-ACP methyl ester carboxylesterase